MMIRPKTAKPTKAEERRAYTTTTARDGGVCVKCCRGGSIQQDHRRNRSQGGLTVPSNLQLLCLWCHDWKTNHPADANAEGWGCPGSADPAVWPARRWFLGEFGIPTLGWVLYDNAGHVLEITAEEAAKRMEGVVSA